ncbi:MAG: amino acid ABC transporter substrate-binding protein [Actinobacteria bacterium]|nr:amino acid ABC transporter substrate-binding protein [Actinomycetota bacterium]NDG76717.1 amino acid ABC transporter substrate-binding protein [Acidimicrobiia bacterium]NBO33076.1 amino acid ABC transporter substrate-binding protein [Actinomycetota bacterium]NBP17099.1 amino acid ABC transporter substrate-binding protein [Actinomycetota bacterium]NBR75885.1 amino acid ABC transporter substrate-binding protein [Actinomycetota bacterium]
MKKANMRRFGALVAASALVLAACGGDDEAATEEVTEETEAPASDCAVTSLNIGTILPVTGSLAFLGPPEVAASGFAVEDINAAGGVLGQPVVLNQGDSGDATTDTANTETDRLLAAGAQVIIGAASSGVSLTVIDKITSAGVVQFSPANTSPTLTTYDDKGLYFRTAPSDLLQGRVLANLVIEDGSTTAAVLYRNDSYGVGLAEAFKGDFEAAGGTVPEFIEYAEGTETFDAEVDKVVAANPDAVLIVGFAETGPILNAMHERGVGPTAKKVYGTDGNISGLEKLVADPAILAGMKGTVPSVDLKGSDAIKAFVTRLDAAGVDGVYDYGAETYDAIVISALAAEIAGCADGVSIGAQINGVTKDGEKCTDFASCLTLVQAGTDIDYDGLGGPYEFVDAGEPAAASFRIISYGAAGADTSLDKYVFAS